MCENICMSYIRAMWIGCIEFVLLFVAFVCKFSCLFNHIVCLFVPCVAFNCNDAIAAIQSECCANKLVSSSQVP